MIKTRFAPSPTGELHIGAVRTALFAYLFAKHNSGEFLLRIEDTDRARLVPGSDERIIESLVWLGIPPDNLKKVIYQSKRLDEYKNIILKLLAKDDTYICNCSKTRLEKLREEQKRKGLPSGYDGHCRMKSKIRNAKVKNIEDLDEILSMGSVVRMKMPGRGKIEVNDLVRGTVIFDASLTDDQVIMKSDGFPTYHLAHVVDDHEMGITHVIRAEEWLPSTPKHVILNQMLGWKVPNYAHLSMILPPDKKGKLSKRHGAVGVLDFRREGYLPEALVNFIAFLGWNPKTEKEIYTLQELINEFKIENLHKAPAIFNKEKLDDINEKYLKEEVKSQKSKVNKLLLEFGIKELSEGEVQLLSRGGYKTLKEMAEEIIRLRKGSEFEGKLLIFKKSNKETTLKGLDIAEDELELIPLSDWKQEEIQIRLSLAVTKNDLTNGDIFWPVRVALSGEEKSPSPVELLLALGKEESLKRIKRAKSKLQ